MEGHGRNGEDQRVDDRLAEHRIGQELNEVVQADELRVLHHDDVAEHRVDEDHHDRRRHHHRHHQDGRGHVTVGSQVASEPRRQSPLRCCLVQGELFTRARVACLHRSLTGGRSLVGETAVAASHAPPRQLRTVNQSAEQDRRRPRRTVQARDRPSRCCQSATPAPGTSPDGGSMPADLVPWVDLGVQPSNWLGPLTAITVRLDST